ncbi:hypothetical protein D1871_17415 [Nakamurella silvestris]|nr:hypothetical protein D1871_17415 [Nakamurella silvestris]
MVSLDDDEARPARAPRSGNPRWRWVAVALALAAAVTVVVVNRQPAPERQSAPEPVPPVLGSSTRPTPPTSLPDDGSDWNLVTRPAVPAGLTQDTCGTSAPLPRVRSAPLNEMTGVKLVIGAAGVLDVDSQEMTRQPVALADGDRVRQVLDAGTDTYLLVGTCRLSDPLRVLRVGQAGAVQEVPVELTGAQVLRTLLIAGDRIWAAVDSDSFNRKEVALIPLSGGAQVPLPSDFWAFATLGDLVVGWVGELGYDSPNRIELFDPVTGRILNSFRGVRSAAVGAGVLLWTGTRCGQDCPVMMYRADTGATSTLKVGVPADLDLNDAVISPDGSSVAMAGDAPAVTYTRDGSTVPASAEIRVLDLRTGRVDAVPGIRLVDRYAGRPSLLYSADGRWLVIGVPTQTGSQVLLWRPGLEAPVVAVTTDDTSAYPPPLAVEGF